MPLLVCNKATEYEPVKLVTSPCTEVSVLRPGYSISPQRGNFDEFQTSQCDESNLRHILFMQNSWV